MPATDLEIALEKVDAGTFEKLAADILSERGYMFLRLRVQAQMANAMQTSNGATRLASPTSPRGPTGNRNSERTHRKQLIVILTVTSSCS